jgi:hypothetical protein
MHHSTLSVSASVSVSIFTFRFDLFSVWRVRLCVCVLVAARGRDRVCPFCGRGRGLFGFFGFFCFFSLFVVVAAAAVVGLPVCRFVDAPRRAVVFTSAPLSEPKLANKRVKSTRWCVRPALSPSTSHSGSRLNLMTVLSTTRG